MYICRYLQNVTFVKLNFDVMEMRERIAKIIASEGLNSSAFADLIGIQRSNISHILNGRNGPSLELLQKILNNFPQYNTDWLVMGRGEIYKKPVQTTIFDAIEDNSNDVASNAVEPVAETEEPEPGQLEPEADKAVESVQKESPEQGVSPIVEQITQRASEVKQVVVLYSDNTFVVYNKQ